MSTHIKNDHVGRLHRTLHLPLNKKLTMAEIKKAEDSRKPEVREEDDFAAAARRWNHN